MQRASSTSLDLLNSRGATFVEFSLFIGLFCTLVFGILEIGRVMSVQSVLTLAAQNALSEAAINPDIDDDIEGNRAVARDKVTGVARSLALQTMVGDFNSSNSIKFLSATSDVKGTVTIEPTGTEPAVKALLDAGQTWEQVLDQIPLTVSMRVEVTPISPFFPKMSLTGRASGYREPRQKFNEPLPIDCAGKQIAPGMSPDLSSCKCPLNPSNPKLAYNPVNNVCQCKGGGRLEGADCTCNFDGWSPASLSAGEIPLLEDPDGDGVCTCPLKTWNCGANEAACKFNISTKPTSTPNSVNGKLGPNLPADILARCGAEKRFNTYGCTCEQCAANQEPDANRTSCICKGAADKQKACVDAGLPYTTNKNNCAVCDVACGAGATLSTTFGTTYARCTCDNSPANRTAMGCSAQHGPLTYNTIKNLCECTCWNSGDVTFTDKNSFMGCAPKTCVDTGKCTWDGVKAWVIKEGP